MPCMGPNLEAAREKGRKVGEELLAKLLEEHRMWDITEPKWAGFGLPNAQERWAAAKEKFVSAVSDLFEEDASNSF